MEWRIAEGAGNLKVKMEDGKWKIGRSGQEWSAKTVDGVNGV
jgi:hypothetical protein